MEWSRGVVTGEDQDKRKVSCGCGALEDAPCQASNVNGKAHNSRQENQSDLARSLNGKGGLVLGT